MSLPVITPAMRAHLTPKQLTRLALSRALAEREEYDAEHGEEYVCGCGCNLPGCEWL